MYTEIKRYTYMDTFKKRDKRVSLYIAQLMKRDSLNSDGAFLTIIHKLIPHRRNSSSAGGKKKKYTI